MTEYVYRLTHSFNSLQENPILLEWLGRKLPNHLQTIMNAPAREQDLNLNNEIVSSNLQPVAALPGIVTPTTETVTQNSLTVATKTSGNVAASLKNEEIQTVDIFSATGAPTTAKRLKPKNLPKPKPKNTYIPRARACQLLLKRKTRDELDITNDIDDSSPDEHEVNSVDDVDSLDKASSGDYEVDAILNHKRNETVGLILIMQYTKKIISSSREIASGK